MAKKTEPILTNFLTIEKIEASKELIAANVHEAWMKEKKFQGFHAPTFHGGCPNKFEKQCPYCHTDLYPYDELPENIKDYDRVTIEAVITAIKEISKAESEDLK